MTIKVLTFGIAKELVGSSSVELETANEIAIAGLKTLLEDKYPQLKNLKSYRIAVNNTFAEDSTVIKPGDELAIIPPVSGG